MMQRLAAHFDSLVASLIRLWRTPWSSLFTALAIGISLSLPAALYVGVKNLRSLAGNVPVEPEVTIFLSQEGGSEATRAVRTALEKHPNIASVRFVSRDEALAGLKARAGLSDVLAGLEENPLPDAFVVRPRLTTPEDIARLAREIRTWKPVSFVQHDADWTRRLNAIVSVGRQLTAILAVLLGAAFVAITANSIRLQITQGRDEIEISRLIGATDPFVRRPFLYYGSVQGTLGGLVAIATVAAAIWVLGPTTRELAVAYGTRVPLQALNPLEAGATVVVAGVLGWLGAYLGVDRALAGMEHGH